VPGRARHRVSSIECQELDIAGSEVLHKSPECVQGVQVFQVRRSVQAAYKAGLTPQTQSKSSKVSQMEDKPGKAGVKDKSTKPK
jgi:hypothetical protein